MIQADVYGSGPRAVLLLHGGRFDRTSWAPQAQVLLGAGFRVVAIDFRASVEARAGRDSGCGYDANCLAKDALAAVRYLRETGAASIAIVGASLGGGAAAQAAIDAPGVIDRVVLIAHMTVDHPEQLRVPALFIVARDDANASGPRLPGIRAQYREGGRPQGTGGAGRRHPRAVPVRLAARRPDDAGHPAFPRRADRALRTCRDDAPSQDDSGVASRYLIQVSPKARNALAGTETPGARFPLTVIVAPPAAIRR